MSKLLSMTGFGLVGLLPAMAGTWLWTRHGVAEEALLTQQQVAGEQALTRVTAGDLGTTLRFENSVREGEIKAATDFLQARQQEEGSRSAVDTERRATEKKAAEEMESSLKDLATKMPGESSEGGAMKDSARTAAKLADAPWPALKSAGKDLQKRLSAPVQQKDLPALEADVKAFEAKLAPGTLPEPQEWEQTSKSLLEEWHRKVTAP